MPKRSIQEKVDRYRRKLQRLEEEAKCAIESSSDSEAEAPNRQPQRIRPDDSASTSSAPVTKAAVNGAPAPARAPATSSRAAPAAPSARPDARAPAAPAHASSPNSRASTSLSSARASAATTIRAPTARAPLPTGFRVIHAPASPPAPSDRALTASVAASTPAATTNAAPTRASPPGARVNSAPTAARNSWGRAPAAAAEPAASAPGRPSGARDQLHPTILAALGEGDDTFKFGAKIHEKLVQIWEPILREGLSDKDRDRLIATYPVPENCTLLCPPEMDQELMEQAEHLQNRDQKINADQRQLAAGVAAVSSALNTLLDENRDHKLIEILADACRILSDAHYQKTRLRKYLLRREVDQYHRYRRDDTLLGRGFPDKNNRIMVTKTGTEPPPRPPRYASGRHELDNPGPGLGAEGQGGSGGGYPPPPPPLSPQHARQQRAGYNPRMPHHRL